METLKRRISESAEKINMASSAVPILTDLARYIETYREGIEAGPTRKWSDKLFTMDNRDQIGNIIMLLAEFTEYESIKISKSIDHNALG